ncbi:MAG TPA: histidine phosphatase family protein [Muricauda sp.]|uniref:Histidine phosphatase family protein n=1 Tax=Flagellimonas aurea TaxID=2915619 RepID=A0ABS3G4E3_9FLAO|nr:histidine phosphatase family protein [Allomuricauda aurea]MAO16973.1 histidine phosphatase family protein [Allomuricauda sp.]MBC72221.1 histidine phosphatase family protein [Allomuricauda sp.]MBO0354276.1 histidine phosphatase family protein [Allomuricauda aurea]HBU78582.1 histidine phosphatase family protein [Allomuricauda sp.]|tara:strand:+ start:970 stop:1494 length:525 start_codon:yes stop_codon:yes gene_type:complete
MRTIKPLIALAVLLVGSIGCKKDTKIGEYPVVSTFYFIRHAEKDRTDPENPDPELNQDGLDRAIRWAEVFDAIPLDIVYSTNYERTSMTAAPTSVKKDIDIKYYDPSSLDIEAFKLENEGKNVLVVGHSNTTPMLVNKVIGEEKYDQMDDSDNSSLFIIRIIDGVPTDIRLKMD